MKAVSSSISNLPPNWIIVEVGHIPARHEKPYDGAWTGKWKVCCGHELKFMTRLGRNAGGTSTTSESSQQGGVGVVAV
jgi:hypothetical protein